MRNTLKFITGLSALLLGLSACDKVDDLPYYTTGNAVVLSSSAATVAPAESDSAKPVLTYTWGDPKYTVDSAHTKFVLELDKVGNNFSTAVKHIVYGSSGTSFTGKELNKILYSDYGVSFGSVTDFEARVTSSYANNNDAYVSNVVPVKLSPYAKLLSPTTGKLFLVGDATPGGWNNPVPANQEFTKIDDKHYTLTMDTLYGKKEFLVLTQNGSWEHKYNLADTTIERNKYIRDGGDFGFDLAKNFLGPERTGKYKIDLDFNDGKFTVTQINALRAPDSLYLIGGATPAGWDNPPTNTQKFTRQADPNVFEITIDLKANDSYLFLPVNNGDWSHKYGANNPPTPLKGTLYADNDVSGSNTPSPDAGGAYKITVDFNKGKFWLEKK